MPSIRISLASPEADLAAAVWDGLEGVFFPRAEFSEQIHTVDARITKLEKLRGIRPGAIELTPMIESPRGVTAAHEIAASSARINAFGVGPNISHGLGIEPGWEADALAYARAECELVARALGLEPLAIAFIPD